MIAPSQNCSVARRVKASNKITFGYQRPCDVLDGHYLYVDLHLTPERDPWRVWSAHYGEIAPT